MRYFILIFTLVCSFVAAQPTIVPQLQQQVTDLTSSLNSQEKKELTRKLESIFNNTQVQIAVLIIPTTKDETIEQYATRVFNNWRLGDAKRNDGILIIVAWSDRTVRIQVGYGLEEKVTDALAGDIIRSNMIPAFKQQKLAKGLELAIIALNNQLTSQHQYSANPSESESASSSDHYYFAIFWVFAVMFFPFWFFHQGSNFCRACKSSVCISAIYLLDLFLFSDKTFSIAVLIVSTTKDETIEQYATRVFDNWRLGDAKRNDGILIVVAWSDRTVRIQVGFGLEEKVTDALAGDIIRSNMIPAFKQQKLAQGLELAINALNNQLTSQHQYPTNPSESESASSSDHYYFAIFWVFAVMFFPFWFFHQGSNFCRACKSGVCISAIYLLDLFLFSDKIFSIAVFSFFFTFTIFMVFTCLCVLQKRASGRSYHSDNSGSAGGSDSGGFSGGGGSSGGGGASGRW